MDRQVQLERANHVLKAMGVATASAKVMDRTHYITFDAKGKGSITELIDSNTRKLRGVTSLDANKFNKGRYFVIDEVRVLVDGTAEKPAEATWKAKANKAVVNSELSIAQDEELLRLPVSDILAENGAQLENSGFRAVSSAPVLIPEKEINIRWEFPDGVGVDSSTTQLVRVEFRGFEFLTD